MSRRRVLLLATFFASGLAALVFELVWTRLLLLSLGTTAVAVGVVLAAFMGGMAAGSFLAGSGPVQRLDPIRTFAGLEGFAGAYALASPWILGAVGGLEGSAVRFLAALLALLPATLAMGASLPVLVRAFRYQDEPVSVGLGQLYAANTAGAVLGPLLAVFWFFPTVGLEATLLVGASLDFTVFAVLLLSRRFLDASPVPLSASVGSGDAASPVPFGLLAAVAISGATAMVYEVAWGRTLSMVYGSSVYGVTIMLSTFLFGITVGSAAAARFLRTRREGDPVLRVAKALAASATLAFASLVVSRSLPFLFLNLYTSFESAEGTLFLSQFLIAALLMLPSTVALGATLPLAVDALPAHPNASRQIARLYAGNLAGSAAGAFTASVLLLASFGLEFTLRAAAVLALAWSLVLVARAARFSIATAALSASFLLVILALDPSAAGVLKSFGIYSGARSYAKFDLGQLRELVAAHELLYYRDGPTATVAVQQIDRFRLLKINGKTDASNGPGDVQTQLLLGHLPFLVTDAERVAVIGWGSGMTAGAVLQHPVTRVDAFEIEPAVIEASRFFEPANGAPLEDERLDLVMGDARNELRRGDERYDLIISEPSNPWLTGVANLFTLDFFEIAAERLAPGGVLCQWFHLYGMSEASTRSLIATFREVFPHVIVFQDRDLILLGAREPIELSMDRLEALFQEPEIRDGLAAAEIQYPSDILVSMTLDSEGAARFSEGAPLNTDDNMRLELAAPRSLYRDDSASILEAMRRFPPDVMEHLGGVGSEASARLEIAASFFTAGRLARALEHVERAVALEPSFEGQKLRGQILQQLGRSEEARSALESALEAGGDPSGRRFVEAMLRSLGAPVGS